MLRNFLLALGALVATVLFMAATLKMAPPSMPKQATAASTIPSPIPSPVPSKSIEDIRAGRRYIAAKFVSDAIRKGLNDPDSLQWDDLYTNEDGTVVCASYRARNAFNGMVRKYVSLTKSGASEALSSWNKACTGKGFFSEKYVVGLW